MDDVPRQLEFKDRSRLADCANSGMAVQEFGEASATAMREAPMLRGGHANSARPMSGKRFLEAIAPDRFPTGSCEQWAAAQTCFDAPTHEPRPTV